MNFCAFAAFSYLFLFSALLPSFGRLFVFYSVLYALFCAFYLKHLPAKRYAAAYGAARPLYTGAPQALFRPKQPWLQRRKKRIAGRPKQSEGRTAGAQPRRAGGKVNAVTLYFLFVHPYFFASPQRGIKKSEKNSVFLPFFSLFMLVFYRFFILFYESASVKKPLISLHSGSSCVLWAGNSR